MPERYFVFTSCSVNASTKKRKTFDLVLVPTPVHGEIRIIVFALALAFLLASLVKSRPKWLGTFFRNPEH